MDGVRLTDAQNHRLASQNEVCHIKKTFPRASSDTAPGAKKEFFLGEVFLGFLIGVITTWVH